MDVNVTTEIKGYGLPTSPSVEREDRSRPQVPPVRASGEAVSGDLDDKALHGREAAGQAGAELAREEVDGLVEEIQKRLDTMTTRLDFTLHEDTGTLVAQVTDRNTGELIRQVPPESMLELRTKLAELVGLLFDEKV